MSLGGDVLKKASNPHLVSPSPPRTSGNYANLSLTENSLFQDSVHVSDCGKNVKPTNNP